MNSKGLFLVTALIFLLACTSQASADSSVTFTDAMGRDIALDKPAERIGFYMVGDAIHIIGAGDKVVAWDGIKNYGDYNSDYQSIPVISPDIGFMDLDFEKLVEIHPDVMIIGKQDWNTEGVRAAINMLEPDIPVVILDFLDIPTMADNYEILGRITGKEEGAEQYISFINRVFSTIREKTASLSDEEKPHVFIQAHGMSSPDELYTYGNGFAAARNLLDIAGATNVAVDIKGSYAEFNPEWLIGKKMDVIIKELWEGFYPEYVGIKATNPAGAQEFARKMREETLQDPIFAGSDAIKNNRVHLADHHIWMMPVIYAAYLAKWSHPDLFSGFDPQQVYNEYMNSFIKVHLNHDEVGIIVYP